MTVTEISWDSPKIISCFTIIPRWVLSSQRLSCSSPVSGLSWIKVDVLRSWSSPEILNSSSIPWNPHTLLYPDQIATVLQNSLPWFCAPLSQQSHLFPIGEVLTYSDSRNCPYKWLLVSSSAPKTFASSFPFPEKFLFSTEYDCNHWIARDSHPSQRTLWSAGIKPPHSSVLGTTVPVRFLQGALVNFWFSSRCRNFGPSCKYCAYPTPILLAALKIIPEKNSRVRLGVLRHCHPQDSPWTLLTILADHATGLPVLFRGHSYSHFSLMQDVV